MEQVWKANLIKFYNATPAYRTIQEWEDFIEQVIHDRDKYWVEHLDAHYKLCSARGKKELTKAKRTF